MNKWRVSQGPYVYADFDNFDKAVRYYETITRDPQGGISCSSVTPHPGNLDVRMHPTEAPTGGDKT